MTANYLLAIDIGSSNVHCLLADTAGRITSSFRMEWTYNSPPDLAPLGREFKPNALWHIVCETISRTIKDAGINNNDILGVSATSQREGMVLLDKDGEELYAGPNIDLRALMDGLSMDSEFGNDIYSITGHTPSFLFAPAKLKWFETNLPETFDKIATVMTISDWITFKLCGEQSSEVCGACELGLIDIKTGTWSDKLRDLLHLPSGIYPQLASSGSLIGRVTEQAAADTGIAEGTPVSTGAPDTQCGLIGMDIKHQGQTGIVMGWSAPIQIVTDQPFFDSEARIWTSCHAYQRRWVLESSTGEAGNAYRWLKEVMFDYEYPSKSDSEIYELMDDMAQQSPLGADGVMAFIGPTLMDMSNLGLKYGGFLFPVPLSANKIGKANLIRAALENLCFAIKANCLQIEMISDYKIDEVTIGGGLARSRFLNETLPSVLNIPVLVPEIKEVSGLGAAMCAAVGSGVYSTLEEASDNMKPETITFEPDEIIALEYEEFYERWGSTSKALEKMSEGM